MELDYKKYNLMLDNTEEQLIGHTKDMLEYYKDYTKELLDFLNYEDYYSNVVEIMELVDKLSKIDKDYLIIVGYAYREYEYKIISKIY